MFCVAVFSMTGEALHSTQSSRCDGMNTAECCGAFLQLPTVKVRVYPGEESLA